MRDEHGFYIRRLLGKTSLSVSSQFRIPDYDPKDWWRYSDGVREVIGESIAYIYANSYFIRRYRHRTKRRRKPLRHLVNTEQ